MAHLTSRHKLTVQLTNSLPAADDVYTQTFAIQGPTDVTFTFNNIQLGAAGIYDAIIDYGDGSLVTNIQPTFSSGKPVNLSLSAVDHTYYQTTSSASTLTATAIIKYLAVSGAKPLSATHNIIIKQTAANMVDKNLQILNSQLFTIAGSATPIFNIESDDNIIYPSAFVEVEDPIVFNDSIYLNTNPETDISLTDEYLYSSTITIGNDLNNFGLSALSGTGFTIQGKSGSLYTVAFAVSGSDDLKYTYTQSSTSILLSGHFFDAPTVIEVRDRIVELFELRDLIGAGNEFSSTALTDDSITFFQSNQLPPEATLYTYTTSTTSTSSFPLLNTPYNYDPFDAATDLKYSYVANSYNTENKGSAGNTGLSAVNRMKTDKDALLIRAL